MKEGYLYAVQTDLGEFWLAFTPGEKLYRLDVVPPERPGCCVPSFAATSAAPPERIAQAIEEVKLYAQGKLSSFTLQYLMLAGSNFQREVWTAVSEIPYGTQSSYTDIARQIGNEKKRRAVGRALKENPLLLVVPCHRVVPVQGGIGGYRGGKRLKQRLLDMEAAHASQMP